MDGAAEFALVAADLLANGQQEAADAVVREGLRQYPGAVELVGLLTRSFDADDDPAAEAEYLHAVCRAAPHDVDAHLRLGVLLLRSLGRLDEADAVLAKAVARFPTNVALANEYAGLAARQNNHAEVVRRYNRLRQLEPDNPIWLAAEAAGLRDIKHFDAADALLVPNLARFGTNSFFLETYAWVAHYRASSNAVSPDWPEALRRWQVTLAATPEQPTSTWMIGRILAQYLQQPAEAERVLQEGLDRFPGNAEIAIEYARVPAWSANWLESLRRLLILAPQHPDHPDIRVFCGEAEMQLQIGAMEAAGGIISRIPAITQSFSDRAPTEGAATIGLDAEHRQLLLSFESLGHNCDFGLVQRHFGAEPLGLLRWNAIEPEALAIALEQRFEGLGASENVRLSLTQGEFIVHEERFGMHMHTFLWDTQTTVPHEQLRQQFIRRMKFLSPKLLEDLSEGRKIFVYQYARRLTDAEMARIEAAVRQHGAGRVLFVTNDMTDHPAGHVEQTRTGRLIGTVDRVRPGEPWRDINFDAWLKLCQEAVKLVRASPV